MTGQNRATPAQRKAAWPSAPRPWNVLVIYSTMKGPRRLRETVPDIADLAALLASRASPECHDILRIEITPATGVM